MGEGKGRDENGREGGRRKEKGRGLVREKIEGREGGKSYVR